MLNHAALTGILRKVYVLFLSFQVWLVLGDVQTFALFLSL